MKAAGIALLLAGIAATVIPHSGLNVSLIIVGALLLLIHSIPSPLRKK
ncbi:hypothetical protein [Subtercola boreus]|nr:hypothetical protein [Subtercola boreus]